LTTLLFSIVSYYLFTMLFSTKEQQVVREV
jgi:hypothetical protein